MIEWIPIEEKAIDTDERILLLYEAGDIYAADCMKGKNTGSATYWAYINKPVKKRWSPKYEERYYYFFSYRDADYDFWDDEPEHKRRRDSFGVYKTKEEAEAMLEKIKALVTEELGVV